MKVVSIYEYYSLSYKELRGEEVKVLYKEEESLVFFCVLYLFIFEEIGL